MAEIGSANSLSSGDALFLYLERSGQPINIAAVCTFDGDLPLDACIDHIESKLPLIPRYLQRVVMPPFDLGLPTWEFDPHFDIRNHIEVVDLKRGTDNQFKAIAGQAVSTKLDRSRPLWRFTFVRGLKGNRTGLIIRLHHCLADGISGVGILTTILDTNPTPPVPPKEKKRFEAPPLRSPSLLESLAKACYTFVERTVNLESLFIEMASHAVSAREEPTADQDNAALPATQASLVAELSRLIPAFGAPTYRLPFNVVCRGPQNFNWIDISLDEMKAVKNACGATINDVVLSIASDAIRRHAELHGRDLTGRSVRIIVPVNLRSDADNGFGNLITFLPVNVPLDIPDPLQLIGAVRQAVATSRKAHMAEVIGIVGTIVETVPTPLQAMLLPVLSELPLSVCNTIVTNVPGPQMPLYLLGHKMVSCYPYVPIGGEMGMNCAVITYNGRAYFGFSGDVHAIPDLPVMEEFLATSFAELRTAAGVKPVRQKRARAKQQVAAPKRQQKKIVTRRSPPSRKTKPAAATEPAKVPASSAVAENAQDSEEVKKAAAGVAAAPAA